MPDTVANPGENRPRIDRDDVISKDFNTANRLHIQDLKKKWQSWKICSLALEIPTDEMKYPLDGLSNALDTAGKNISGL